MAVAALKLLAQRRRQEYGGQRAVDVATAEVAVAQALQPIDRGELESGFGRDGGHEGLPRRNASAKARSLSMDRSISSRWS
jgi:hypothetical protein